MYLRTIDKRQKANCGNIIDAGPYTFHCFGCNPEENQFEAKIIVGKAVAGVI
jgi:hypothetical protein